MAQREVASRVARRATIQTNAAAVTAKSGSSRGKLGPQTLAASQVQPLLAELFAQRLVGGLEMVPEREKADLGNGFSGGDQPIVIPGAALKWRGTHAELVLARGMVAEHHGQGQEACRRTAPLEAMHL